MIETKISVRLDDNIYKAVKQKANRLDMSINTYVINVLLKSLSDIEILTTTREEIENKIKVKLLLAQKTQINYRLFFPSNCIEELRLYYRKIKHNFGKVDDDNMMGMIDRYLTIIDLLPDFIKKQLKNQIKVLKNLRKHKTWKQLLRPKDLSLIEDTEYKKLGVDD